MTGTARREGIRLRLAGLGWLLVWRLARLAPERVAVRAFERFGLRSWRRNERRRHVVRANLAPVVPAERLDAAVRDAFRSYARYWAETFRMEDVTSAELDRRFRTAGIEHIEKAHAAGRGAVLATPHLGNWDAGGRWVAERWPLTVVVEVLRPRRLFDRFVAHRRALGMTIIPLQRGGDATGRCLERLAAGDLVALVADRDLSGSGVSVRMFGRTTRLPAGPAVLALRAGVPLIPAAIFMRDDGTWWADVRARIDEGIAAEDPEAVARLTQRLAESFESLIAHAPEQWHAFQPVWADAGPPGGPAPAPASGPVGGGSA